MVLHRIAHTITNPNITKHAITLTIHHHHFGVTMIKPEIKQIAVDPLSLKQQEQETAVFIVPPPLQPPKSKFLSISQPNSAPSSPRFASKTKSKVESLQSPPPCPPQSYLHKSKSCGQGRTHPTTSDDFDIWSVIKQDSTNFHHHDRDHGSFTVKEGPPRRSSMITSSKKMNPDPAGKGFKCSCLFIILGFGKAKQVRPKKEESHSASFDGGEIPRTLSLEKFDCGSWAASPRAINPVVLDQVEGNDSVSSYFDLPSELIRCGVGGGVEDAHSPVAAAFLFDSKDIKGVLKNGSARINGGGGGRKSSDASPRHVRFSTSSSPASPASPSCITPRLRKAREEFNAFLEAQS